MTPNLLKQFLELYWLRPETALMNSLLAKNLPADCIQGASADVSCGDGLFPFIAFGGEIEDCFNLYECTNLNFGNKHRKDIYNYFDESYSPPIIKKPAVTIGCGIDINVNMLLKAEKLGIYENLCIYSAESAFHLDNNDLLTNIHTNKTVRISENKYDTVSVFSSAYMYSDTDSFLSTIYDMLNPKGTLILNVKTPSFKQFYVELEKNQTKSFSNFIERDMRTIFPSLWEENAWERYFIDNRYSIENKTPVLGNNMVPLWSVGLRFLSPLLIKMSQAISPTDLLEIKREFVDSFYGVSEDYFLNPISSPSSWLYVLKKA